MIKHQYKIIESSNMEREVESMLRDGWQLQGGVSTTVWGGGTVSYAQAMLKAQ